MKRLGWIALFAAVVLPGTAAANAAHDLHGAQALAAGGHADHGARPGDHAAIEFDEASALKISQGAIGRELGSYELRDTEGRPVHLERYRGKPLVVSLIYTSCAHVCPTTTRHLAGVVKKARAVLGEESFQVVTIGFDTPNDTPAAMRTFARQQGAQMSGWDFLSADAATIEHLSENLGFLYRASPRGFDHLVQATLVDADGRVRSQVYGMTFETPQLVEPLKRLVLGEAPAATALHGAWNRVRLFCTTYDPASDSYRFDYSLFVGIAIGVLIVGSGIVLLVREFMRNRRASAAAP
jgi:protein SCO1/2